MVLYIIFKSNNFNFIKQGPATIVIGGKITLVGIASFVFLNDSFCATDYPSAFARVSTQLQWIRKNTDVSERDCN
jgi:hypothetical protein